MSDRVHSPKAGVKRSIHVDWGERCRVSYRGVLEDGRLAVNPLVIYFDGGTVAIVGSSVILQLEISLSTVFLQLKICL